MDPYATAQAYTLAHKKLKADWYYTEPRFSANRILLDQAAETRARLARLAPAAQKAQLMYIHVLYYQFVCFSSSPTLRRHQDPMLTVVAGVVPLIQ